MNSLLKDKKILIMGVANKWSIAWAIAQSCRNSGAQLVFSCQGEKGRRNLEKLTEDWDYKPLIIECDVTNDEDIKKLFEKIKEEFGLLHGVVHGIAYAKKRELDGLYINTSREGYKLAQDISAYSLVAVAKYAKPLIVEGGSIVALTYLGGQRVVRNYNVMGVAKAALESSIKYLAVDLGKDNIRVNGISAAPVRTLSAKGVKGFIDMLKGFEEKNPMGRAIEPEEIGNTAVFLCSPMSSGITGEIIHVDGGYNVLGY